MPPGMGLPLVSGRESPNLPPVLEDIPSCIGAERMGKSLLTWSLDSTHSVLEVNVGIMCACSIALPTFCNHYWPRTKTSKLFPHISSYFTSISINGTSNSASITAPPSAKKPGFYHSSSSEQPHSQSAGWSKLDQEQYAEGGSGRDHDALRATHTTVGRGAREEDLEEWGQRGDFEYSGFHAEFIA